MSYCCIIRVNGGTIKEDWFCVKWLAQQMFVAPAWKVFPDWLPWALWVTVESPRTSVVIQWLWTLLGFHLAYMLRLGGSQTCSDLGLLWLCPCYCWVVCMLHSLVSCYMVSFMAFVVSYIDSWVVLIFQWKQRWLDKEWHDFKVWSFSCLSWRRVSLFFVIMTDIWTWFSMQ